MIQAEAQTYRILPLVPNPTPTFFVKHANGDLEQIANQCTHTETTVRISTASGSERVRSVKPARYRSRY